MNKASFGGLGTELITKGCKRAFWDDRGMTLYLSCSIVYTTVSIYQNS